MAVDGDHGQSQHRMNYVRATIVDLAVLYSLSPFPPIYAKATDRVSTTCTEVSDHDSDHDSKSNPPEIAQSPNSPTDRINPALWQPRVHRPCYTVDEHTGSSDVFQGVETNKQKEGLLVDHRRTAQRTCNHEIGLWTQIATEDPIDWRA